MCINTLYLTPRVQQVHYCAALMEIDNISDPQLTAEKKKKLHCTLTTMTQLIITPITKKREVRKQREKKDRQIYMIAEQLKDTLPTEKAQGQNKNHKRRYSQPQLLFDIRSLSCILKNMKSIMEE